MVRQNDYAGNNQRESVNYPTAGASAMAVNERLNKMRIGFANIYAWRPHTAHALYLSDLLSQKNYQLEYLICRANLSYCYNLGLKDSSKLKECPRCISGGLASYVDSGVTRLSKSSSSDGQVDFKIVAASSVATMQRIENPSELQTSRFEQALGKYRGSIETTYRSTRQWIRDKQVDAVLCFNGRIDHTAAIVKACEDAGITFVTHERSQFGDGIQLVPNGNCLSLASYSKMAAEYGGSPLTIQQATIAAQIGSRRFLGSSSGEWRTYNNAAKPRSWPISDNKRRVLILPSSHGEILGEKDWATSWPTAVDAFEWLITRLGVRPTEVVVRFHPVWAQKIGSVGGGHISAYFEKWCREKGYYFLPANSDVSTLDLISSADDILLTHSSAALEAGLLGKSVYSVTPSYKTTGFAKSFVSPSDFETALANAALEPREIIRRTLRHIYFVARRYPQFCRSVQAISPSQYNFFSGADSERLERIIRTGELLADDSTFSQSSDDEDVVISEIETRNWSAFAEQRNEPREGALIRKRRYGLDNILRWREFLPAADR